MVEMGGGQQSFYCLKNTSNLPLTKTGLTYIYYEYMK